MLPRIHGAGRTLFLTSKSGTVYEVIGYDAVEAEIRLVHTASDTALDWIFEPEHARNYTHTISLSPSGTQVQADEPAA